MTPDEIARLKALAEKADGDLVIVPRADYQRLLNGAADDDMLIFCEVCEAWIDRDDEACASVQDFHGCWKVAAGSKETEHLCRSYRAPDQLDAFSPAAILSLIAQVEALRAWVESEAAVEDCANLIDMNHVPPGQPASATRRGARAFLALVKERINGS